MRSTDFVDRFHGAMSEFLHEVQLSKHLTITTNPQAALPLNIPSSLAASSLQKYISNLEILLDVLKSNTDDGMDPSDVNSKIPSHTTDPELVQIVASNTEIERRIQAFMTRKQAEVDEANCREFCSIVDPAKQESTCARTDSVFSPREGTKSHVKVSRVAHAYGPQTRPHLISAENIKLDSRRSPQKRERNEGIEERLHNAESFLKLRRGGRVPDDVYQRLKSVEERILELESLSPEYFSISPSAFKRQRLSRSTAQDTDLDEINSRIKQLEDSLKRKTGEVATPTENSPTENKAPPEEVADVMQT